MLDFEPIGMIAGLPVVITARKDFPADDLQEFISLCEGERRQGERRACRRRLDYTHHVPAAAFASRRATDVCAVQRRRAGHECIARRAGRLHLQRHPRRRLRTLQSGAVKVLCHQHSRAQSGPAECPDIEGSRLARVRCISLERACLRPRGRRRRSSTSSPMRSTDALDDEGVRQSPARSRLRRPGQITARPTSACGPGHQRDRALDADHQGGEHQSRMIGALLPARRKTRRCESGEVGRARLIRLVTDLHVDEFL